MDNQLLWLEQLACQQPFLVGSKAANLSRLAAGYCVPLGYCLTTAAFAAYPSSSVAESEGTLPAALQTLLADAYQELATRSQQVSPPVAVRSSAIGEDGQAASFAGQYETYLNVVGTAALYQAVARCWASAQNARVCAYRQQQGQGAATGQMAVLVQQLVAADVAVVAFSANPVTRNTAEIVINATWGLGESLVGGTVTPDSYTVRKADLAVTQQQYAAKSIMTIRASQGVSEVPVPRAMQRLPALTAAQAQEVAAVALTLEEEMGWPVDIECAYQGGKLYLLQCRPITVR
jgi:phosphoenolpyruvate synthase/pyruvate phosphate dikinase